MTAKELKLADSPVTGYMMYSYHLAATFSHVDAWPWFFSNYVQLQCKPAQLEFSDFLDFTKMPKGELHFTAGTSKYNPWLADSPHLDSAALETSGSSVLQYIADSIDNDCYVETFVDEFHIPALFNGNHVHFGHRLLIYGYDSESRRFNIIGFDKNKLYRKLECSYDEFERAFDAAVPKSLERTVLFKPSPLAGPATAFDLQRLLALTKEYLSATNTLLDPDLRGDLKEGDQHWYGLKTYDFLEEYVSNAIDKNVKRPDIRGLFVFWEHKKCMLDRLKWMQREGYAVCDSMIEQSKRVVSFSERARNRMVMYNRGLAEGGSAFLTEIPAYLAQAKILEVDVLERLLALQP